MQELTDAQKEAYARASTSVVDLFSFELRHSTFPSPIRMISYDQNLMILLEDTAPANAGETVEFIGVAFKPPQENINSQPGNSFSVAIAGISEQALPYLNLANESLEPINATIRYVSYDTKSNLVIGVSRASEMQVQAFVVNMLQVQMTLGFTNLNNRVLDV